MAEYIEKQAVIDAIDIALSRVFITRVGESIVSKIPPADVRLVRRGKWIKVSGFCTPGGDPVWECSECRKGRHVYGIEHGTYGADISDGQWVACPNCGADMRDENDG